MLSKSLESAIKLFATVVCWGGVLPTDRNEGAGRLGSWWGLRLSHSL